MGDRPWSLPGLSVLWGFALPSQPCLLPTSTSPWGKKSSSRSGEQDPHNEQVHIMRVRAPTQPSCFPLSAGWGSPPFPVLSSQKGPNGRPGQGRGGWAGSLKEQPSWYCYFCSAPTGVVVAPPCSDYGPRTQHRRGSTQVGLKSHTGLQEKCFQLWAESRILARFPGTEFHPNPRRRHQVSERNKAGFTSSNPLLLSALSSFPAPDKAWKLGVGVLPRQGRAWLPTPLPG